MTEPVTRAAGPGHFPVEAIRGVRARSAPAAACGMFADVTVDFEPSRATRSAPGCYRAQGIALPRS